MCKQRIDYIDVAKGLCMVLVVWQHTHTYYLDLQTGEFWMEAFRMPLFFLISGMFFKMYSCWNEFIRRKFNTLIFPFLFYYLLLSVLVPNLLALMGYEGLRQESKLGWASLFNCIFEKSYSNNPIWFLIALIWMNLLFYSFHKLSKRICEKHSTALIVAFTAICGLCGFGLGVNRIFVWANIGNALTCLPFYAVGYYLKNLTPFVNTPPNLFVLIIIFLVGGLSVFFFSHGLSFKQNQWEVDNLLQIYGCGILGSMAMLSLSKCIERSKVLKYYGENTLTILCLQMPVIQVCNTVVRRLQMNDMHSFLLTFLLSVLAFFAIIPFMNKYLPWVTGKRQLI